MGMAQGNPKPREGLIKDHKWRPGMSRGKARAYCGYMNCRQTEEEHEDRVLAGHMGIKLPRRRTCQ